MYDQAVGDWDYWFNLGYNLGYNWGWLGVAVIVFGLALLLFLYFLPSILGRKKRDWAAIFVLNLFFGWSFIGWVLTLVWALKHDAPTQGGR